MGSPHHSASGTSRGPLIERLADAPAITRGELQPTLDRLGMSDRRFKRLRLEGLVLCLGQRHPKGRRGSETWYPGWTPAQMDLLVSPAINVRDFSARRLLVAWHGGWVDPDRLRGSLVESLESLGSNLLASASGAGEAIDADELVRGAQHNVRRSSLGRVIRERLGGSGADLESVLFAFAALVAGDPLEWVQHDPNSGEVALRDVFDLGLGLDRARKDWISRAGPLLAGDETTDELIGHAVAAGWFQARDLGKPIRDADHGAIAQALRDARALASLATISAAVQAQHGPDVAGLRTFDAAYADIDASDVAFHVRQSLLLRSALPLERVEATIDAVLAAAEQAKALLALIAALPHRVALLGPDNQQRIAALSPDEREAFHAEAKSVLSSTQDVS